MQVLFWTLYGICVFTIYTYKSHLNWPPQLTKMIPLKIKSAKTCNAHNSISNQDLISNLPHNVIDNILKRLPIKMVAKMSILSWNWRQVWLSLKHLIFNKDFWDEEADKYFVVYGSDYNAASRCYSIISNILFHHVGSVLKFKLCIPSSDVEVDCGGWLSLLSKVGVQTIVLCVRGGYMTLPPYIYNCKDLVKLKIEGFTLDRPPSHFKGFAYLQSLELRKVTFKYDVFSGLIANCPRLRRLIISGPDDYWTGNNYRIVLDAPNLEYLTIEDEFETIVFKNVPRLRFVLLHLHEDVGDIVKERIDHFIQMLASSCQLQRLYCGGQMCKHFGAGCITMSPTLKFLNRLRLTNVDLNDFNEFCFTISMVQCCPFMKYLYLDISVNGCKRDIEHEFEYNKNCELGHLVKVKLTGITGSSPELKLIGFLLSIATKLENLAFKCGRLDLNSELKVTRDLLKLPRTSPKAKLVCL